MLKTAMEQVADKSVVILSDLHGQAVEALRQDEDNTWLAPEIKDCVLADERKFVTLLRRAVDSVIKWQQC